MLSIQLDRDRLFMIAEEALEDGRKRFFLVAVSYGLGGMVFMGPYGTFFVATGFRDDFLRFP